MRLWDVVAGAPGVVCCCFAGTARPLLPLSSLLPPGSGGSGGAGLARLAPFSGTRALLPLRLVCFGGSSSDTVSMRSPPSLLSHSESLSSLNSDSSVVGRSSVLTASSGPLTIARVLHPDSHRNSCRRLQHHPRPASFVSSSSIPLPRPPGVDLALAVLLLSARQNS